MRRRALRWCAGLLAAFLTTAVAAPAAHAQEPAAPALADADVTITMADGGVDAVSSRFRLTAPAAGSLPVLLLGRGDAEVVGVTGGAGVASVDGTPDGSRLAVDLEPGTQEFVLEHSVRRAPQSRAVPLLVPEIDTDRDAAVRITVQLPDGQRLVGDSMPTFEQLSAADGVVTVQHTSAALPSVVVADYGTGARLSMGTVMSGLGVGFLVVVSVLWFRHSARQEVAT